MTLLRSIADWRPRTRFYYGWLVLGTAALGAFAATGVAQVVLGGIQSLIFEDLGWDRSTIAYAVTAGTWTSGFLTPFVGRLVDRHGPRGMMPVAAVVVGICFFALSGVQAVWHFYVAYIVARAIANPILVGVVPRTVAVNFFHRRRNLALGLTAMARPVGGAINIQTISLIAQAFSWRVAYRALGVFALALAVPLFLIMRRRPEDIGLQPDGDERASTRAPDVSPSAGPNPSPASEASTQFDWRASEAVRTPAFWLIVGAGALLILTDGAVGFQVVPYLRDSGLAQAVAAGALSLSALLGALASPVLGYLADRYSPRTLAVSGLAVTAGVTSLFLVTDSGQGRFVVVILWGTTSGGIHILSSIIMAQYFGTASFGSITGLTGPIQMVSLGLGPTFGAVLFSLTGGYTALFVYAVSAFVGATVLLYSARPPRLPSRALTESRAADD